MHVETRAIYIRKEACSFLIVCEGMLSVSIYCVIELSSSPGSPLHACNYYKHQSLKEVNHLNMYGEEPGNSYSYCSMLPL